MADKTPEQHSRIVGGSTAKRVINCPGSVKISEIAPKQESSKYADEGTLLHNAMARLMSDPDLDIPSCIGMTYNGIELVEGHIEDKIMPALQALDEVDPAGKMEVMIETEVGFRHKDLKGVFGTCDVIGRLPDRAVVLDWKFGNGVVVEAEENHQLMFYAAAAMQSEKTKEFFTHSEVVELVIVQPPMVKRWETTLKRIKKFEKELIDAVNHARSASPILEPGEWCKWCPGQQVDGKGVPYCPKLQVAVDRMSSGKIVINGDQLAVVNADGSQTVIDPVNLARALKSWRESISPIGEHLEKIVRRALEAGIEIVDNATGEGWKLVQGKKSRDWKDETDTIRTVESVVDNEDQIDDVLYGQVKLQSVAQIEKALKKLSIELPSELVVESYGAPSLVPLSDKREAIKAVNQNDVAEAFGKIAKTKTKKEK